MKKISEKQARKVLEKDGSPAANSKHYESIRVHGGWSFRWREDAGVPRPGTIGWVVADNGKYRGQPLWATAEEVTKSLLAGQQLKRPWN